MFLRPSFRILLTSVAGIVLLSACSRYQYVLLGSRLPQNENQEYVVENDSVQIKYSFSGENFPLTITVYNKLLQPVYFDLRRTTVIINNIQTNVPDLFEGHSDFIAPQVFASIKSSPLKDRLFDLSKQDSLGNKPRVTNVGKIYSFTEEITPLFMRIVLALSPNEDYSYPTFYDYSFWVSDIIQNYTGPKEMKYRPSNQFYLKKSTALGKTLSLTGAVAIIVLGGLMGLDYDNSY